MMRFAAAAVLAAAALCHGAPALALQSPAVTGGHSSATLVSEADSFIPGHPFRIGLKLTVAPGWHTYWKNPGDAGAPPTLDVTGAQAAGSLAYPLPQKLQDGPFTTYAYSGDVLLPMTVTAAGPGPARITAHATYLVCAKICVPEDATLSLTMPAGDGAPGADAALFRAADQAMPRPSPFPARLDSSGILHLDAPGLQPRSVLFLPDEPGVIDQGAAQEFSADAAGLAVRLKFIKQPDAKTLLSGVLVLTDQSGRAEALQMSAPASAAPASGAPAAPAPAKPAPGLLRVLLLAFAGGLILNLMPCVLPVLAMKAMALVRLGGAARAKVRQEAALYMAGVLTAFLVAGGATLAAGALGGAAGWGFQFQSVAFTAAMTWLMLAVALNFLGVFEVGAGAAGLGSALAERGSFFTGLLAVVVATPCTAPFMAAALAATLTLPPAAGMAVFLALGLGLGAPYGILAIAPGLARHLPRPGAWMIWLRRALAVPMALTAFWLASVVARQAGTAGLILTVCGGVLVAGAAAYLGRAQHRQNTGGGTTSGVLAGAAAACALLLVILSVHKPGAGRAMALADGAEAFTPARLADLRAAHRPVFVDMSAAWCITCLVNERIALSPPEVRQAFAKHGVAYLVGDWTRQDPSITAFLRQYGRAGVPLYVWFPRQGAPEILPQILTPSDVLGRAANS